jgi:hypothetical protein
MISIELATRLSARARFLGVFARARARLSWWQGGDAHMTLGWEACSGRRAVGVGSLVDVFEYFWAVAPVYIHTYYLMARLSPGDGH